MLKNQKNKRAFVVFGVVLMLALGCLGISVAKNNAYNSKVHQDTFSRAELFAEVGTLPEGAEDKNVSVAAIPRGSTWTKVFDFNSEGLTEHNY